MPNGESIAKTTIKKVAPYLNRIVDHGEEAPDQLLANPANWRIHPKSQQDALNGVLNEVGWVQNVIVNRKTGHLIDGHLRVALALRKHEQKIPVVYVDLSPQEEALVLASLDPLAAMAVTDKEKLDELMKDIQTEDEVVLKMLKEIVEKEGLLLGEVEKQTSGNLSDRFGVPPFSVLNAREGWWQDRKAAWIALGIKSELGRGGG